MAKSKAEIIEELGKLNELKIIEQKRPDGSLRYALDFSNCVSLAEQHTAHLSDLNYLIEKYKPDELAAYLAARTSYRQEILGHDFAKEPSLQEAKNAVYKIKQTYEELPNEIKNQFQSAFQFMKFLDNPQNQQKMIDLGLLTDKQVKVLTAAKQDPPPPPVDKP